MTAFQPRSIEYADETAAGGFGSPNQAGNPSTATFTKRIPVIDVRMEFTQDRATDQSIQVRQNESRPGYLGAREGFLEFDVIMPGFGATTAGAIGAMNWFQELLSKALGGSNIATVGGTVTAGATTTSLPFAAATLQRGGLIRVGAPNDGRAEGHFYAVGNPASPSPATLLTAMAGVPNNGDVIYAAQLAYPAETGHVSMRFLVGWNLANAQYVAFGCQAAAITFKLVMKEVIIVTFRYRVAYWAQANIAIPTVATLEDCKAAAMLGGSVVMQTVGTTTRATKVPNEIDLTLDLGLGERPGLGGQPYQGIQGLERTMCVPSIRLSLPHEDLDALYGADGSDSTHKYFLITCNRADGRALSFWLPRTYIVGPKPVARDFNTLVNTDVTFRGRESTDTTNEMTRAPIIIATA